MQTDSDFDLLFSRSNKMGE